MKFCGQVGCVKRTNCLDFGEDPDLDPATGIFTEPHNSGVIESIYLRNFMCHACLGPFNFGLQVNFLVGNNGSKCPWAFDHTYAFVGP
uniref:Uncharacterized protein n=1 Tax=Eptatretus burgeri TaxID=7764 RepID=A0A8C4QN41_EPTBU